MDAMPIFVDEVMGAEAGLLMSVVPKELLKMILPSLLKAIAAISGTRFSSTAAPKTLVEPGGDGRGGLAGAI
jgi:hypothetical protein